MKNQAFGILPRPKLATRADGVFRLTKQTTLVSVDESSRHEANFLRSILHEAVGLRCRIGTERSGGVIKLLRVKRIPDLPDSEHGYRIRVTPDETRMEAATDRGLFHATQSLLDMVEAAGDGWGIPCGKILDWPDFRYRGFMADPARHFFPLERLKWTVDNLARNKYTHFHLHMADAESFTLPIRRYPGLNEPLPGP